MKCSIELRFLAIARRIAKALEEGNDLARYRNEREFPPLNATEPPPRRKAILSRPFRKKLDADPEN